jgi:hypothetical protein
MFSVYEPEALPVSVTVCPALRPESVNTSVPGSKYHPLFAVTEVAWVLALPKEIVVAVPGPVTVGTLLLFQVTEKVDAATSGTSTHRSSAAETAASANCRRTRHNPKFIKELIIMPVAVKAKGSPARLLYPSRVAPVEPIPARRVFRLSLRLRIVSRKLHRPPQKPCHAALDTHTRIRNEHGAEPLLSRPSSVNQPNSNP